MSEYKISRRIGRGGMAEVFLAMQEGIGGFEKVVTVKRIFPHFCEDEKFVQMFLDEARLAAAIRHPNVVEILDIKQDDDGFFIVMEYLSGESLAYVFDELREKGEPIPAPIVCRIGADIAAGLHAAHTTTEVDGQPQPIIHRDVTPSNLIVCFNGHIKVVDFGVAKATIEKGHSRPGTLKGKIQYLAPEQVEDRPVDARTDVFQLGVVLHEMFTGERLFLAGNDHRTMNAVLERVIPPPSEIKPGLPAAVDEVVLAALERDPEQRTQTADQLRRGLEEVLVQLRTSVTQQDVAEWMSEALPERLEERVKLERDCVAQMREGRPSAEIPAVLAPFAPTAPVTYDDDESSDRATAATVAERPSGRMPAQLPPPGRSRRLLGGVVLLAVIMLAAGIAWQRSGSDESARSPAPPAPASEAAGKTSEPQPAAPSASTPDAQVAEPRIETYQATLRAEPAGAQLEFDGRVVGAGAFTAVLPRDGATHEIRISAPGYQPQSILFRDAPPPAEVTLEPLSVSARNPKKDREGRSATPPADTSPASSVESTGSDHANSKPKPADPADDRRGPRTDNKNPWQ